MTWCSWRMNGMLFNVSNCKYNHRIVVISRILRQSNTLLSLNQNAILRQSFSKYIETNNFITSFCKSPPKINVFFMGEEPSGYNPSIYWVINLLTSIDTSVNVDFGGGGVKGTINFPEHTFWFQSWIFWEWLSVITEKAKFCNNTDLGMVKGRLPCNRLLHYFHILFWQFEGYWRYLYENHHV